MMDSDNMSPELQETLAKAAVLAARDAVKEIEEHLGIQLDLRSFMVGGAAFKANDVPIPTAVVVGAAMEAFGPELDRLEMERAAEGDPFADLPIFDPEKKEEGPAPIQREDGVWVTPPPKADD